MAAASGIPDFPIKPGAGLFPPEVEFIPCVGILKIFIRSQLPQKSGIPVLPIEPGVTAEKRHTGSSN
ncbi:MAG: hypothetical protein WC732_02695 [Candidatus Omnitrophota bacterium]